MASLDISKKFLKVIPNQMSLIRSHIKNASESELSFPKFRILANINRGLNTVGELAELQCVSQPAISKLVDSLVSDNYITRHESAKDRRVMELQLTKEGCQKFLKVRNNASKNFQPNLELLDEKELKQLQESLEFLEAFFNKVQERKS